jgi:hypothetical protein
VSIGMPLLKGGVSLKGIRNASVQRRRRKP